MTFSKQKLIDIDCHNETGILPDFDFSPWSICQLKYDGHWCRLEFDHAGRGLGYTTGDRVETEIICPDLADCTFIGEHIFGTNWAETHQTTKGTIVLFDCVRENDEDISRKSYKDRYGVLGYRIYSANHSRLFVAHTRSIGMIRQIWNKFVLGPAQFEGLVLRNWNDPYTAQLHRTKRDFEVTYTCIGFEPGKGKHEGRLGALITQVGTIGGGFSDSDRQEIWEHQETYLGREFDAKGKGLFESGSLRHPNFLRWK